MTPHQHEILHALRSERGKTLTAAQIRARCPSISQTMDRAVLTRLIETTDGVKVVEPARAAPSGRVVFAARFGVTRG